MEQNRDEAHQALKRLLANGPLAAVPKRPSDQRLLAALAASNFEPRRDYREREVNEILEAWLRTFCGPRGIDHVTLRRLLVDSRLLSRTASGSAYRLNPEKYGQAASLAAIAPARVLAEIRGERESRRRAHAT
jgi:hypothetical protein